MAGGNLMQRVMHYVMNEFIVDRLSHSPSFQRFAVRTSRKMDELKNKAVEKSEQLAEQMKEASRNMEDKYKY